MSVGDCLVPPIFQGDADEEYDEDVGNEPCDRHDSDHDGNVPEALGGKYPMIEEQHGEFDGQHTDREDHR